MNEQKKGFTTPHCSDNYVFQKKYDWQLAKIFSLNTIKTYAYESIAKNDTC